MRVALIEPGERLDLEKFQAYSDCWGPFTTSFPYLGKADRAASLLDPALRVVRGATGDRQGAAHPMLTRVVNFASLLPQLIRIERRYRQILHTELPADFERLRGSCERLSLGPHEATKKFLRSPWYLREALCRARALGLHRGRPIRILDLGSGAGYFLLAARSMGHEVYGFDLDDNELYNRIIAALGLQRFTGSIEAFESLDLPHLEFDLITGFSITFDRRSHRWRRDEWQFLIRDLRRLLADDGRIFLRLNRHLTESSPDLDEMFVGAEGFACRVCDFRSVMLVRSDGRGVGRV